jgi:hypothetical protein
MSSFHGNSSENDELLKFIALNCTVWGAVRVKVDRERHVQICPIHKGRFIHISR